LPFSGRKIILRCLHGLGDSIQYLRYVPMLRSEAARVTIECPKRLMPLAKTISGVDAVVSWELAGQTYPDWDQQIEITELPLAYRTTLGTIPCEVPYLFPCPANLHDNWRGRAASRFRVGLVWAASAWNAGRSIKLADLEPLLQIRGIEFCALQAGPERDQLYELGGESMPTDLTGEMGDLLQAASFLLQFDLLISVDTMMAHLAGALGMPVWLMLTRTADWRWMLDRTDSPWYPSMRIFRQLQTGNWDPVVFSVKQALEGVGRPESVEKHRYGILGASSGSVKPPAHRERRNPCHSSDHTFRGCWEMHR